MADDKAKPATPEKPTKDQAVTTPVDTKAQEKAAEEREKTGGYQ